MEEYKYVNDALIAVRKNPKLAEENKSFATILRVFKNLGEYQYIPHNTASKDFNELWEDDELKIMSINTYSSFGGVFQDPQVRRKVIMHTPPIFTRVLYHVSVSMIRLMTLGDWEAVYKEKEILKDIINAYDSTVSHHTFSFLCHFPSTLYFLKNSKILKTNIQFVKYILEREEYTEDMLLEIFKHFEKLPEYFLHLIMLKGHRKLLKYMIELGYDAYFDKNFTLSVAAYSGLTKVAKVLLSKGAKINYCDGLPLRFALYGGQEKTARFLIESGADVTVNNNEVILIAKDKCPELIELIQENGGEHDELEKW